MDGSSYFSKLLLQNIICLLEEFSTFQREIRETEEKRKASYCFSLFDHIKIKYTSKGREKIMNLLNLKFLC